MLARHSTLSFTLYVFLFDNVGDEAYNGAMTSNPLAGLDEALRALRSTWAQSSPGDEPASADSLPGRALVAVNDAIGAVRRHLDAVHAQVAAEIARQSRSELGAESLAKQHGYRNPVALVSATTGTTGADAARLIAVGGATAPRTTLTGQAMPPKYAHIATALRGGRIGAPAAAAIIHMLDRVCLRAERSALDRAEQVLAAQAPGLSLDQLAKIIARVEAHLDPDGIEPAERDRRGERAVHLFERDGMLHITGRLDVESGAPLKVALEALVSAEFRAARDGASPDAERPTVPQMQADALSLLARHALGCAHSDLPLDGATVIVRLSLDDLESGTGVATIDGIAQPVSVGAARRMAAGGGIIPCILGTGSEILDWGREKRLFTRAQRLALVERDGGCAMCGVSPGLTRAHHLRWWWRDHGPTDLDNGVLLCESCHHRIHDNGWEIRIDGTGIRARVWFIPPPHVDPARTPRLGGRARFDHLAA